MNMVVPIWAIARILEGRPWERSSLAASEQDEFQRMFWGQLDAERQTNRRLLGEIDSLKHQVEQLQRELNSERQKKFATNQQKAAGVASPTNVPPQAARSKKRGPPQGHPGWFRPTPDKYDMLIEVDAPCTCPFCGSDAISVYSTSEPVDHLQEDLREGSYHVTLFRHPLARCRSCRRWVQKAGEGEILGSCIGPTVWSMAIYLRNEIGITYRKVPRAIEDMFQFRFTPAALIGFETMLADRAQPLVDDVAKKLGSNDGPVHADEAYWILDGERAYYWVHGTEKFIHFQFDTSRAG